MTNNIAKIRAALEAAKTTARICVLPGLAQETEVALAALAELERVAAPVPTQEAIAGAVADILGDAYHCTRAWSAWSYGTMTEDDFYSVSESDTPNEIAAKVAGLYAAPPAPVAEIRDVVVTDEMCDRAYIGKWRGVPELIGHEPDDEDRQWSREWLEAWRSELGPALGLVEIREPTPEECERICTEYERLLMREGTCGGRDAFDACRAVMWPKEGL